MGSGILTVADGLPSALSQGNNTQKVDGGCCGLAGDRRRSTTCCNAAGAVELAPGLRVADSPQHMCRIVAGEVLHRTVRCWHNCFAACGDSGLLYAGTIVV